jgi:hypothetical protein
VALVIGETARHQCVKNVWRTKPVPDFSKSIVREETMMKLCHAAIGGTLLFATFFAAGEARAWDNVGWQTIIGIIQAGNVVGGITGGGEPWSTLGGQAFVDLQSGTVQFQVKGLVLAGGNAVGTPDAVTQVEGTLVCSPGSTTQAIFNTPPVALDAGGNASFFGSFTASTAACNPSNTAFLITIPANGHWIANGAVAFTIPVP